MEAASPTAGGECFSNADFQCLQDQLVDLRTKNYQLTDTNKRYSNDLELAKTKISQLQRQLEEQEGDFQQTTTTLRYEIEQLTSERNEQLKPQIDCLTLELTSKQLDLEEKEKKLKFSEIKCTENEQLLETLRLENEHLKCQISKCADEQADLVDQLKRNYQIQLEEQKSTYESKIQDLLDRCERYTFELEQLRDLLKKNEAQLQEQIEERKITEKKGLRMVKELKRQVLSEQNRAETLQKRLQEVLNSSCSSINAIGTAEKSTNGADNSSVGSWSFMPNQNTSNQNQNHISVQRQQQQNNVSNDANNSKALNETLSLCSINDSDSSDTRDLYAVQNDLSIDSSARVAPATPSEVFPRTVSSNASTSSPVAGTISNSTGDSTRILATTDTISLNAEVGAYGQDLNSNLKNENATLVDRLTRLQQQNWFLEEKLNYLETTNCKLAQDIVKKSEIIRHYCMESGRIQGGCTSHTNHYPPSASDLRFSDRPCPPTAILNSTGTDFLTATQSHGLLNDKKMNSVKKVVDFIKERSGAGDLEHLRESTRKMQLMLEETLTKNIHLQKNLDILSEELAKLKSDLNNK